MRALHSPSLPRETGRPIRPAVDPIHRERTHVRSHLAMLEQTSAAVSEARLAEMSGAAGDLRTLVGRFTV